MRFSFIFFSIISPFCTQGHGRSKQSLSEPYQRHALSGSHCPMSGDMPQVQNAEASLCNQREAPLPTSGCSLTLAHLVSRLGALCRSQSQQLSAAALAETPPPIFLRKNMFLSKCSYEKYNFRYNPHKSAHLLSE